MYHQGTAYLNHWLNELNTHSLHSPFIYTLYSDYIKKDYNKKQFKGIEKIRKNLIDSKLIVSPSTYGTPSTIYALAKKVKASTIAKKGLSLPKISRLLARLIDYNEAKTILELGTSFGINTLYLATNKEARVTTFEGSKDIADVALTNFEFYDKKNINLILGNINTTLPKFVNLSKPIDFAYIDANHKYQSTINYFNTILERVHDDAIVVLDDIYWSKEMTQAWNEIKNHSQVTHSIDLFFLGIVFFKPDLVKTNYQLMF